MKKEDEQFLARQQEISARNKELSYIQGKIEMQRSRILEEEQKLNVLEREYLEAYHGVKDTTIVQFTPDTWIYPLSGAVMRVEYKEKYLILKSPLLP